MMKFYVKMGSQNTSYSIIPLLTAGGFQHELEPSDRRCLLPSSLLHKSLVGKRIQEELWKEAQE